jgi:hypothetical protein
MIHIAPYEKQVCGLSGYHINTLHGNRFCGAWSDGRLQVYRWHDGQYKSHLVPCRTLVQAISMAHRWCQGYDV